MSRKPDPYGSDATRRYHMLQQGLGPERRRLTTKEMAPTAKL
jgi:hypothetical protein